MKTYFGALFFLIPLAVFTQTAVMCYNIRNNNPDDNENWWKYRKTEVTEMINYYNPEILGIQEGLNDQVKYLDSNLSGYKYIGVGRDDGKQQGEYAAIFYKTETMKLLSSKTYWLSETPDHVSVGWDASMERVVTFGKFLDKRTNDTLYVFNAHFDHRGKIARKKSVELILSIIENMDLFDKKVILMGDFNSEPTDEPIKLIKTKLVDYYNSKNVVTYGPTGTFHGFDTGATINKRIDYIFTKNIKAKTYVHIDDRRKNKLYLSDHLPVLLTME